MRITCPNCNAHYEIDEDLIPAEGRDVQCSNCGTTWFQSARARPLSAVEDRAMRRATRPLPPVDEDAPTAAPAAPAAPPTIPRPGRRPAADDAALAILREERAREDRLRAGTQEVAAPPAPAPEPPAPEADPRKAAAAERARMAAAASHARARDAAGRTDPRGSVRPAPEDDDREDDDDDDAMTEAEAEARDDIAGSLAATRRDTAAAADGAAPAAVAPARRSRATRRELLPDIEEINSSLRPDERVSPEEEDAAGGSSFAASKSRNGFRLGFSGVCLTALVLAGLYVVADPVARTVPSLADPLAGYVRWVDARRLDLSGAVEALTEKIAPET